MLQYKRINVSEGIDINKSNKLKGSTIFCYWYFKNVGYKFKPYACNGCHDISMMVHELESIVILNVKDVDCRCVSQNITKNDAINRLKKF